MNKTYLERAIEQCEDIIAGCRETATRAKLQQLKGYLEGGLQGLEALNPAKERG